MNAGLKEEEAQIVAFFSEFVDDMILNKVLVGEEIKEQSTVILKDLSKEDASYQELAKIWNVFREGDDYVEGMSGAYSCFIPSITSFDTLEASLTMHQFQSVIPFHFYPKQYREKPTKSERADLRTSPADAGSQLYQQIQAVVIELKGLTEGEERIRKLVEFGVLLHVYADTYAHNGFSGANGWENTIKLLEHNGYAGIEAIASKLPSSVAFGHLQLGHLPDWCDAIYKYKRKEISDGIEIWSDTIERTNKEFFKPCAEQIFKWCKEFATKQQDVNETELVKEVLRVAASVEREKDTLAQFSQLSKKWSDGLNGRYKKPEYEYDINKMLQIEEAKEKTKKGKPVYKIGRQDLLFTFTKVTYDLRRAVMGKY